MAKAFYHEGLTIESDVFLEELRIEGRKVDVEKEGELFVYKERPEIVAQTLDQLGKKIIDSWRHIKDNRKDIMEEHLQILNVGVRHWNQWRKDNPQIRPILYNAPLDGRNLSLEEPVDFSNTNLIEAHLSNAILIGANFHEANLGRADLSYAELTGAHFCRTDLYETNLSYANLNRANLQGTQMAMTNLTGAELKECKIYGMSAWDLQLDGAKQKDLNIIYKRKNVNGKEQESRITVGDLETAQFVYLLLDNPKIRNAINTITRKVVLILGRFYDERKEVLDALRDALVEKNLVPIVFDFEHPENRDLTETVQLLANMSKFVIADITDAKSIPQELSHVIPFLSSVPVMPILLEKEEKAFSMFEHWLKFPWVLPVFYYEDKTHLVNNIELEILNPVANWENKKEKISEQKKKIEDLKKNDHLLYTQLKEQGIIID